MMDSATKSIENYHKEKNTVTVLENTVEYLERKNLSLELKMKEKMDENLQLWLLIKDVQAVCEMFKDTWVEAKNLKEIVDKARAL